MLSADDRRRIRFWRPETPSVTGMFRVEHEDRTRVTSAARARELLRSGVLVAEVAQSVGFCDESQLHRHFRRIVGIPPGVYARSFASSKRKCQHRPSRAGSRDA